MGDRDKHRSRKSYDKDRRRKRYDDDDDDDDDYKKRRESRHQPTKGAVERILTPGTTANNVVKTAATGIIAGGTILLMGIYGLFGDRLAGASYLPMATAVASAVGTACVWIFGRPKTEEIYNEEFTILRKELRSLNQNLDQLQAQNTELEERLANVELLESFEDKLAKHTLDKQTQTQTTAQRKPSSAPISSNMPSSSEAASEESSASQREME